MKESTIFTYDGISSVDMGVIAASPSGGLFEENFLPSRELVEVKIPNNPIPYLQGVEYTPLSFSFSFYLADWVERRNHREIAQWLFKDYYKPMTFASHPNKLVYAIIEGDTTLLHNGMEGYVTTNVRCNSPFVYGVPVENEYFEVLGSSNDFILNSGDLPIKPKFWIRKIGAGNVAITNNTNGQRVEFNDLSNGEEVFVDFKSEQIVSSLQNVGVYRYNDHNDVWLQLETEENDLTYEGDFEIRYEYQYQYLNFWGD